MFKIGGITKILIYPYTKTKLTKDTFLRKSVLSNISYGSIGNVYIKLKMLYINYYS